MLFDTHVNLHAEQFAGEVDDILARARAAGVTRFVTICDRLDRYPAVRAIAEANDDITCTVGVHPHYAKDYWSLEAKTLVEEARHPKVVGIGETGLDQHYGYSDIVLQERSFVEHIHAARETGLLLVVHTREADDLTGDILEREGWWSLGAPHEDAVACIAAVRRRSIVHSSGVNEHFVAL